jgi:CrcB protein
VNLAGCFAIGLAMTAWPGASTARLALTTGVLGGFTTYSAFGFETLELLRHGRVPVALVYVGATVAGGLLACAAGAAVGSRLGPT